MAISRVVYHEVAARRNGPILMPPSASRAGGFETMGHYGSGASSVRGVARPRRGLEKRRFTGGDGLRAPRLPLRSALAHGRIYRHCHGGHSDIQLVKMSVIYGRRRRSHAMTCSFDLARRRVTTRVASVSPAAAIWYYLH